MRYLLESGKPIFLDFLSTIFFFLVFSALHNVLLATAAGIFVGVAQVGLQLARKRPVDAMQWLSVALVVLMGGATLITRDPHFIMVKPTIIYLALACVMLRPGWQVRYAPTIVSEHLPRDILVIWGYLWAGLMAGIGLGSLAIAFTLPIKSWVWFISIFANGLKLALFGAEYLVIRLQVRARILAARAAAAA